MYSKKVVEKIMKTGLKVFIPVFLSLPMGSLHAYQAGGANDNSIARNTAVGSGANANGTATRPATAIGFKSDATTSNAVAIGTRATADNKNTLAIGTSTLAKGSTSSAIGYKSQSLGGNSVAVGTSAEASKTKSTALGWQAKAASTQSIAIGAADNAASRTTASGKKSIAIGAGATTTQRQSMAIGTNASATGVDSIAQGTDASATQEGAIALGDDAKAIHTNSVALGANSETTEDNTVSVGKVGAEKKITNVADGVNAKDAVNVSQLDTAYNTSMSLSGTTVKVTDGNGDVSVDLVGLQTTQSQANAAAIASDTDGDATNELITSTALSGTNLQINEAGTTHTVDLSSLDQSTGVSTNAGNIVTNTSNITTNTGNIAVNTSNITTNTGNIAVNTSNITTNTGNIAVNTSNITTNTGNIADNTSNIITNTGNIATNADNITTNSSFTLTGSNLNIQETKANGDPASDLSVDLSGLETNQGTANAGNIATNSLTIDTNTRGIASNAQGIRVNSSRISANTQRIIRVEDKVKYIHVNRNSTALGSGAVAKPTRSVAVGKYARVERGAKGSVAVGAHSTVKEGVQSAVALGQYSVANEANTISVGNANLKRRITNVADGINPYDAVNMRQFNALGGRVDRLDRKVRGIGAMSSAMSALVPNDRVSGDTQLSLGLGQYGGETAFAMGIFHYVDDNVLLNAGASYSKESGTAARLGATWGF